MNGRRCTGCGAPLPKGSSTCEFCRLEHDEPRPAMPLSEATAVRELPSVSRFWQAALVMTIAGLFIGYSLTAGLRSRVGIVSSPSGPAGTRSPASAGLRLEQLRLVPIGTHPLAVDPPAGGYAAWDPVVQASWAQRIAQAWSGAATLQRIDVTGVSHEGLLDLRTAADAEVIYRFWPSPKPVVYNVENDGAREAMARAARLPGVVSGQELWIRVKQARPVVVASELTPRSGHTTPLRTVDSLPLRDIFTALTAQRDFDPAASYQGYLDFADRDGWIWNLRTASGSALPRIRARDGRAATAK